MLGTEQREWFLGEVTTSTTTWTAWANEVLTMPFKAGEHEATVHPLGHDAWDGYQHERELVMEEIGQDRSSDGGRRL